MKKKVLFVITSLNIGGAEKVFSTLLKNLNINKYDLYLITIYPTAEYAFQIPKHVTHYPLNSKKVITSIPKLFNRIKKVKPSYIFSTLGHPNVAILLLKTFLSKNIKIFIREGSSLSHNIKSEKYSKFMSFLYSIVYPKADKIICQSNQMKEDLNKNFSIPSSKCIRIYNPIEVRKVKSPSPFKNYGSGPHIISVGRLDPVKQFDDIIRKIPEWLEKFPNLHYWIIGDGPLNKQLKQLTKSLNLDQIVHFLGFQKSPENWITHADLFILCSKYEGLPNSLLEAISFHCPVLVRQHPGGTEEIMKMTGLESKFKNNLCLNSEDFEKPNAIAQKSLIKHFGLNNIIQEYEALIDN